MGDGRPRVFADSRGVWRQDGPGQEPWGVWWYDIEAVQGCSIEDCAGGHLSIELVYDGEDALDLCDFWPGFGQVVRAVSTHLPGMRPGWLQDIRRQTPNGVALRVWDRDESAAAEDLGDERFPASAPHLWPRRRKNFRGRRRSFSKEAAIEATCWIPENRLREFLEILVADAGVQGSVPGRPPQCGAVWLDKNRRLEQPYWERLQELVALSDSRYQTWVGFSWRGRGGGEVWCGLQRDVGYGGVVVQLALPPVLGGTAVVARQAATSMNGGA